jgi:N utilization substance protein B
MKAAYQIRIGGFSAKDAVADVLAQENFAPEACEFIQTLIMGMDTHIGEIDAKIRPLLSAGWDFDRLAEIDRALLRLACFELFYMPNIPPKATISEAVTLAKRYGTEESGRFVNGVLGSLFDRSPKVDWTPPAEPDWSQDDPEPDGEPELEVVEAGSPEHESLTSVGPWKRRRESTGEDQPG